MIQLTTSIQPPRAAGQTAHAHRSWSRSLRWLLLGLALALLVCGAVLIGLVGVPGWQAYRSADQLLITLEGGLDASDAPRIEQQIVALDASIQQMAEGMQPLRPVLRGLSMLPTWGPTLAESPELMAFGRELSAMAAEGAPALTAALAQSGTAERAAALVNALEQDPGRMQRLAVHASAAATAYKSIDFTQLPPALAGRVEGVGPLLEVLPTLLKALPGLPAILGMDKPHTLLVLVQNNHELRPTGGFITAVGRVTIDKGEIVQMDFQDSYVVYRATSQYPAIPAPMLEYMGIPYMTFRDSNWSPDLPTSSEIARSIYKMDMRQDFDDVVTIDLNAVELVISALSPLKLDGIDEPVTGSNILEIMKQLWASPLDAEATIEEDLGKWWRERKNFIPELAQAAVQKVMGGQANYLALAAAGLKALNQRDVQLYTRVDPIAGVLSELGWDGSLQPPEAKSADFFALVDTNMGYNKANAAIKRSFAYSVTWPTAPGDRPLAELSITYTHTYTGEPTLCAPEARYSTTYDDLVHRCYFDYLRLYVPGGSALEDITGVQEDSITSTRGEKGTQVFAGYFGLKTGSSNTVTIRYRLPETITPETYSLRIQRQSGTSAAPVTLQIGEWQDEFSLAGGRTDWLPERTP